MTIVKTPSYRLTINGRPAPMELIRDITRVTFESNLFKANMVTLDIADSNVIWIDSQLLASKTELKLSMGYFGTEEEMFEGVISRLEPEFPERGYPRLALTAYDYSFLLRQEERTRTWKQVKVSEVVQEIGEGYGLRVIAEDSQTVRKYLSQQNETDWAFMEKWAKKLGGYEVKVEGRTLYFRRPKSAQSAAQTIQLCYYKGKKDLLSFRPTLTEAKAQKETIVRSWDPINKREIIGKVETEKGTGKKRIVITQDVESPQEADQIAHSYLENDEVEYITASGRVEGRPALRAGRIIEVSGVGRRYSGAYYLTRATHVIGGEGYGTDFDARSKIILEGD